ncbi:hypothetical protein [uncultured Enterovirga sp.]|uniref:hypothetical protein n=1 Tax=uncultured Enterovirga sp. TaxID=2026352 RepID=UPI0035CBC0EF
MAGFIGMNNVLDCELDFGRAVVAGVPLAFALTGARSLTIAPSSTALPLSFIRL